MEVALYHTHHNQEHLEKVKAEMLKRGAPTIRAIWSECYELFMAVEGCHRLRAAHELGIVPVIKDVSSQKTIVIQSDGDKVKVNVKALSSDLEDRVWRAKCLQF